MSRSVIVPADNQIRAVLASQGDDGQRPRRVEHLACFNDRRDAKAFASHVEKLGYEFLGIDDEFGVTFVRISSVAPGTFDQELTELREAADRMGGQYDGWGCLVVLD